MTSSNTDPQPDDSTGLEPGGSVPPGETPPGESSTSGAVRSQPDLPSGGANKVVYGIVIAVAVLAALTFVGYAIGLMT